MKFGGTSVATPEARMVSALRVVQAKEQGFQPVVVVSAIGRRGAPYATDTLLGLLRDIEPGVEPEVRETDMMVACGEILSAVIFAQTLKTLGHPARAFRGEQAGIETDKVHGNARIVRIRRAAFDRAFREGSIPVVCGFQGYFQEGDLPGPELTTLGRGGSDTTASALGVGLKADAVEIFTDVDGIKTADPDAVPDAPTLRRVTYDEIAEFAHLGAKVVHPRAVEIAMAGQVPLWVKNTFTDDDGTLILPPDDVMPETPLPGVRPPKGVTHTGKLVYIQFSLDEANPADGVALKSCLYATMARYDVNLFMLNISPTSTGFAVPREQYPLVKDVLDGLVVPIEGTIYLVQIGGTSREVETQARLLEPLGEVRRVAASLTEGCTMVSLVGYEFLGQPGLFYRVLSMLADASIPVLQTGDSDYSLSVLVPESETNRTVRVLHDRFGLAETVVQ